MLNTENNYVLVCSMNKTTGINKKELKFQLLMKLFKIFKTFAIKTLCTICTQFDTYNEYDFEELIRRLFKIN